MGESETLNRGIRPDFLHIRSPKSYSTSVWALGNFARFENGLVAKDKLARRLELIIKRMKCFIDLGYVRSIVSGSEPGNDSQKDVLQTQPRHSS